jgi:hypothetical protein
MTGPEFGLEDPELQVPNRLRISNSKLWRRLKFSNNVDAFGGILLSAAKTSRINPFEKNKKRSFAPLRMTISGWDLVFGILNFEQ